MEILIQIAGWAGTIMVVLAYYLVSHEKVHGAHKYYQFLNLFGAIGIGINVYHQQAWSAFVLQIVWAVITIASMFRKNSSKRK